MEVEVYLMDNGSPVKYSSVSDVIITSDNVKILYEKGDRFIVVNYPPQNVLCVVQEYDKKPAQTGSEV